MVLTTIVWLIEWHIRIAISLALHILTLSSIDIHSKSIAKQYDLNFKLTTRRHASAFSRKYCGITTKTPHVLWVLLFQCIIAFKRYQVESIFYWFHTSASHIQWILIIMELWIWCGSNRIKHIFPSSLINGPKNNNIIIIFIFLHSHFAVDLMFTFGICSTFFPKNILRNKEVTWNS